MYIVHRLRQSSSVYAAWLCMCNTPNAVRILATHRGFRCVCVRVWVWTVSYVRSVSAVSFIHILFFSLYSTKLKRYVLCCVAPAMCGLWSFSSHNFYWTSNCVSTEFAAKKKLTNKNFSPDELCEIKKSRRIINNPKLMTELLRLYWCVLQLQSRWLAVFHTETRIFLAPARVYRAHRHP